MTPTALWLRFDIPYPEDATIMRADLGFRDGTSVGSIPIEGMMDIPGTVEAALKISSARNFVVSPDFTLVIPLDSRHGVAWVVKEEADKRSYAFSRHIPPHAIPSMNAYPRFATVTGSPEDDLPAAEAKALVIRLNTEAQEFFSTGMDMPDAMSCLRHALQTASKHMGWTNPAMVYTLRNFGYVMRATGNDENLNEFLCLSRILADEFDGSVQAGSWDGDGAALLEQTAGLCATSGDETTGRRLMEIRAKLAG